MKHSKTANDKPTKPLIHTHQSPFSQLVWRLHGYIGIFIAPFIFVAAFTGMLYIATPQLEQYWYASILQVTPSGSMQPLSRQVAAAKAYYSQDGALLAIRPAAEKNMATRVQFNQAGAGPSESIAVFVNPYTLAITGETKVYGTSGLLPLRTTLDHLHQNLLLGSYGRAYSELAASWMWIAALGGLWLYWAKRRTVAKPTRQATANGLHRRLGLVLSIGMLFLSITGITWSQWAGSHVASLRANLNWATPKVNDRLVGGVVAQATDAHAEHHAIVPQIAVANHSSAVSYPNTDWDRVLNAARNQGLQAAKLEIRPPKAKGYAWVVNEIDLRWPTQADSIALEPLHFRVLDRSNFADFPLAAKLTRWGVDAHIGVLFGIPNQLLLLFFGLGLCSAIVLGYRITWQRRANAGQVNPAQTLLAAFHPQQRWVRAIILALSLVLGWLLPALGVSLLLMILLDIWRWYWARQIKVWRNNSVMLARVKRYRTFALTLIGLLMLVIMLVSHALLTTEWQTAPSGVAATAGMVQVVQFLMIALYSLVISGILAIPCWVYLLGDKPDSVR